MSGFSFVQLHDINLIITRNFVIIHLLKRKELFSPATVRYLPCFLPMRVSLQKSMMNYLGRRRDER